MHDVFFFTDIHGMYDLYRAIMDYCHEQDPEAVIIFGGDACDRGPAGYKIMKELLDNPKVMYLKGNHEDLFVDAAHEIYNSMEFHDMDREEIKEILEITKTFDDKFIHIQDSLYNGGIDTLVDWIIDGMPLDFVDRIEHLPLTFTYENYDFCHAGSTYRNFKHVADMEYNDIPVDNHKATLLMWTRSVFNIGWKTGRTVIFGHTPVPCLNEFMEVPWHKEISVQPYKWIGREFEDMTGARIDMDTGAAFTGAAYVLNVLTMKAQGFEDLDITSNLKVHDVKKIDCVQM